MRFLRRDRAPRAHGIQDGTDRQRWGRFGSRATRGGPALRPNLSTVRCSDSAACHRSGAVAPLRSPAFLTLHHFAYYNVTWLNALTGCCPSLPRIPRAGAMLSARPMTMRFSSVPVIVDSECPTEAGSQGLSVGTSFFPLPDAAKPDITSLRKRKPDSVYAENRHGA